VHFYFNGIRDPEILKVYLEDIYDKYKKIQNKRGITPVPSEELKGNNTDFHKF
jgi:hypothetical protein